MKRKISYSLFACAVLTAMPLMRADDSAPAAAPAPAHSHGGHRAIWSELGLNDDQKAKVRLIHDDERTQIDSVKADKSMVGDARKAKIKEIKEAHAAQIRALLTPEQQAKFDALRAKAQNHSAD